MTETPSINLNQIERDIKALWGKASQSSAIDGAVSRACLSNLIIYTDDEKDQEMITATIAEFILKHPCRAILIIAQPKNAQSKLEANVFTHTPDIDGKRKKFSCEQITLHVSGPSVKELASVVQPLLVPDLPVYLWWRGMFLTQKSLVQQMLPFTDRFIYDGVSWTNLQYTVPQVADYIEKYKESVGFTNFNWSRLRPWREYAADFFDSGMFQNEVWDINRVRVEYMALPGQEEGYQFRALLFVAWLATQLEWEPVKGKPGVDLAQFQFTNKKETNVETELILIPQTSETSQSIQKVVMGIQRPDHLQEFIIQRDHKDHVIVLSYQKQGISTILRKVPHADSNLAELLFRELGRRVRNRVFEKSFKMASNLIQML